ncbi:MAG: membrane protein insertase YidC [Acidobacteriota bacterium]
MTSRDQNDPGSEKRLLLALLLSTGVLLGTPYVLRILSPAPPPGEARELVREQQQFPSPPEVEEVEPPRMPVEAGGVTQATPRTIEVVNKDVVLALSNVGGVVKSARLLHYFSETREPLEMVVQGLPASFDRPLALRVGDPELQRELKSAVYEVEGALELRAQAPVELTFRYRSPRLSVTRRIRVPESGYAFGVVTELSARGRPLEFSLYLGPGIGKEGWTKSSGVFGDRTGDFLFPKIAYYHADSVERYQESDVEEMEKVEVEARWVAFDSQFFSYFLFGPSAIRSVGLTREEWSQPGSDGKDEPRALLGAEVGLRNGAPCEVFFGPKDLNSLHEIDPTLTKLVDYGWFAVLVKPLVFVLQVIYGGVHNYGWAIIILTFVINLALLPIRYKQMASMKKMSQLQPQLKAIQDRYKKLSRDDPKKQDMNKEVMALYQRHGVNPLGGCLPLLIQMPFLFAFYRMLASSIELRGAPFIWWIQDLSKHDPYYVTPIVMGLTMVVQQKVTPATGDPSQRRMMMLMPVVFTFFFLSVSSGLALYFLFSNIFGVLLQLGMQKMSPAVVPMPAKKKSGPAKKRRRGRSR